MPAEDAEGDPNRKAPVAHRRVLDAETAYALLIVVLLGGLAAASYAAYEVLNPGAAAVCSVNSHVSCAAVAASGHTSVLGVPDWAIGMAGYSVMLIVGVLAFRTFDRRYLKGLAGLSGLALVFVAYFVYNETVVIGSICPVCTTAHVLDVVTLALTLYLLRLSRPDPEGTPQAAPADAVPAGAGRPNAPA